MIREATTITEMLEKTKKHKPDIVITEVQFSDGDALQAIEVLTGLYNTKVIAFTTNENWEQMNGLLKAGGLGFVPKRCSLEELAKAIKAVIKSKQWISSEIEYNHSSKKSTNPLTPRECEVAILVAKGFTSRQIAAKLCVSLKTVETHRYRIFKRLNIQNRAELVNYVIKNGMMPAISD